MRRLIDFLRDRGGASAVEFGLVLPGFVALSLGMIYLCLLLYANVALHYAVEDTARCVAVQTATCTSANYQTYGASHYLGPGVTSLSFATSNLSATCGKQVTGTASFNLFNGLTNKSVSLSATSCFPA